MLTFILWCILFVLSWLLALRASILYPFVGYLPTLGQATAPAGSREWFSSLGAAFAISAPDPLSVAGACARGIGLCGTVAERFISLDAGGMACGASTAEGDLGSSYGSREVISAQRVRRPHVAQAEALQVKNIIVTESR